MIDKRDKKALLLGVGFDGKDGHTRITKGHNFYLVGGSKDTHSIMQEKAIKFNEELKKRHKVLEDIGKQEFHEIAEKIDMEKTPRKPPKPKNQKGKETTDLTD